MISFPSERHIFWIRLNEVLPISFTIYLNYLWTKYLNGELIDQCFVRSISTGCNPLSGCNLQPLNIVSFVPSPQVEIPYPDVTYNNGTLRIEGVSTTRDFELILKSLKYENKAEEPYAQKRTVQVCIMRNDVDDDDGDDDDEDDSDIEGNVDGYV